MLSSSKLSLAAFCNAPQNDVEADVVVADGDEIILGDTVIKVMSTPGHTLGSVCYIAENCIFREILCFIVLAEEQTFRQARLNK